MLRSTLAAALVLAAPALAQPAPDAVVRLAERGDADALRQALADGASVDARGIADLDRFWGRRTPLMAAARAGHADLVTALLDAGADPTATDSLGRTALWHAAQGDAAKAARRLLDAGTDLDATDAGGGTAATWAAFAGAAEALAVFLDAGLDPNAPDARGTSLLLHAIQTFGTRHANAESVALLLDAGADPDRHDGTRWTPLLKAVAETPGGLLVTHLLVEAGADGSQAMGDEQTAAERAETRAAPRIAAYYAGDPATRAQARLLDAVLRDDAAAVTQALADGAAPQAGAQDDAFYTADYIDDGAPIHLAARLGALDALRALVAGGAAVDAQEGKGQTALALAAERGDLDMIRALLALGAMPDGGEARPFLGILPVHLAAIEGHDAVVAALLDAGAEPGYTTNAGMGYGYHALGFAVHYGHADVVRRLLDAGMTTEYTGENPATPLDLALERGWPEVAAVLRARGAVTTAEAARRRLADGEGWDEAVADGDIDFVRALLDAGPSPPPDALRRILFSLQDDPDLVEPLVAAGADVDARGDGGLTALHEAAANAFPDLVAALLAAGADRSLTDDDGRTALDLALDTDDPDTIAFLDVD